jgi:hypothetical protein
MCHGGISRNDTRVLIARAHGRTSSYVISDIGAISPGRWHLTQDRCRIGATSFVNVSVLSPKDGCCVAAMSGQATTAATIPDAMAILMGDLIHGHRILNRRRSQYHFLNNKLDDAIREAPSVKQLMTIFISRSKDEAAIIPA